MAVGVRVKCPNCGHVMNLAGDSTCPKCSAPLSENAYRGEGMVQLYRMGSPIGVAVGYGLYLDDAPMGHLANTETVFIPVSFGQHKLHVTCGMTRKCQDLIFTVSPEKPHICAKARIKAGFWSNTVIVEEAAPSEMPAV